jgi:hypothetical protein
MNPESPAGAKVYNAPSSPAIRQTLEQDAAILGTSRAAVEPFTLIPLPRRLLRPLAHLLLLLVSVGIIVAVYRYGTRSDLLDFTIYYGAGERVRNGLSPYTGYGPYLLPFQYVLWIAWLFAPLSLLPIQTAWRLYMGITLVLMAVCFFLLKRLHRVDVPASLLALFYALSLVMCLLLFRVGQVGAIQLLTVVLIIVALDARRPVLAGLLVPLVIIKPQLVVLFLPAMWIRGGRATFAASIAALAVMSTLATLVNPTWLREMMDIIAAGQARNDTLVWYFTTLPGLLGRPRTFNLPAALALFPIGAWILWRLRALPVAPWLSIAAALSLLVAPYSFAYDLLLLIPALLWLTSRWRSAAIWLWFAVAAIPWLDEYSGASYLVTLAVVGLSLHTLMAPPSNGRDNRIGAS